MGLLEKEGIVDQIATLFLSRVRECKDIMHDVPLTSSQLVHYTFQNHFYMTWTLYLNERLPIWASKVTLNEMITLQKICILQIVYHIPASLLFTQKYNYEQMSTICMDMGRYTELMMALNEGGTIEAPDVVQESAQLHWRTLLGDGNNQVEKQNNHYFKSLFGTFMLTDIASLVSPQELTNVAAVEFYQPYVFGLMTPPGCMWIRANTAGFFNTWVLEGLQAYTDYNKTRMTYTEFLHNRLYTGGDFNTFLQRVFNHLGESKDTASDMTHSENLDNDDMESLISRYKGQRKWWNTSTGRKIRNWTLPMHQMVEIIKTNNKHSNNIHYERYLFTSIKKPCLSCSKGHTKIMTAWQCCICRVALCKECFSTFHSQRSLPPPQSEEQHHVVVVDLA